MNWLTLEYTNDNLIHGGITMDIGKVHQYTTQSTYSDYYKTASASAKEQAKVTDQPEQKAQETGVVYEPSSSVEDNKATYSINRMSEKDRAALVEQLKAEQEARQQQLVDLVRQMFTEQSSAFANASDIWKFLASGEYTVDPETQAKAQQDIAEDGYYGVKNTAQRIFDFACALAGDDIDKMKEMQAAFEKGFKQATDAWGKELPDICKETFKAVSKMFDDYYKSKEEVAI